MTTTPGDELEDRDLPVLDEPPRSGVFIDHDDAPLTDEDIALGNALGDVIDIDDDDDNGLVQR